VRGGGFKMKAKLVAQYWKFNNEGIEEFRVEIMDRPDYPVYAPNSFESMPAFILEELSCMEELPVEDIEVEFREVSRVQ
jgi:hypothetical protein